MGSRSSEGGAVQSALSIRPASGPTGFYGCGPKAGKGCARCSYVVCLSQHLDYLDGLKRHMQEAPIVSVIGSQNCTERLNV